MTEVWLRPNQRVLKLSMVPVVAIGILGAFMFTSGWQMFGGVAVTGAAFALGLLIRQFFLPRIALRGGMVLFYLRAGSPLEVPLHLLEAFFQGQGPTHLPGESPSATKVVNLVARLSRRETEFHERDVKPALGSWADGYVTIRGTWCEPIDTELIRRLNRRISELSDQSADSA